MNLLTVPSYDFILDARAEILELMNQHGINLGPIYQLNNFTRVDVTKIYPVKKVNSKIYFFYDNELLCINTNSHTLKKIPAFKQHAADEALGDKLLKIFCAPLISCCNGDNPKTSHLKAYAGFLSYVTTLHTNGELIKSISLPDGWNMDLFKFYMSNIDSESGNFNFKIKGKASYSVTLTKHNEINFSVESLSMDII